MTFQFGGSLSLFRRSLKRVLITYGGLQEVGAPSSGIDDEDVRAFRPSEVDIKRYGDLLVRFAGRR